MYVFIDSAELWKNSQRKPQNDIHKWVSDKGKCSLPTACASAGVGLFCCFLSFIVIKLLLLLLWFSLFHFFLPYCSQSFLLSTLCVFLSILITQKCQLIVAFISNLGGTVSLIWNCVLHFNSFVSIWRCCADCAWPGEKMATIGADREEHLKYSDCSINEPNPTCIYFEWKPI